MASQVIVNPEELERFARELKQFTDSLEQNAIRLQGQFGRLGGTWRDQEHKKFAEEFEQTMRVIARFTQTTNQHVPFLLRKARAARAFLDQR